MTNRPTTCPNCGGTNHRCEKRVHVSTDKLPAALHHCSNCDFLFLDSPSWLARAYEIEFYGDTGYVQRNLANASFLRLLLLARDLRSGTRLDTVCCDFGTGLGMLPRIMRDYGYDFWGDDQYSSMQLIRPFSNPKQHYDLMTAFEVVEHIQSLPQLLQDKASKADMFVFSTLLRKNDEIPANDWWYYAFQNGQHISFHSLKSLTAALRVSNIPNARLLSNGSTLHAVSMHPDWEKAWCLALRLVKYNADRLFVKLTNRFFKRDSLTWSDHLKAMSLADT